MTTAQEPTRESPSVTAARRQFERELEEATKRGGPEAAQRLIDEWHRNDLRRRGAAK